MSLRLYLNEIGAPEGSWSLDDGDQSKERSFRIVEIEGSWRTKLDDGLPDPTKPRAWIESEDRTAVAICYATGTAVAIFNHATGMTER